MAAWWIFFVSCLAVAQVPVDPRFDPSDVYFQAYLETRAGEQLERDGDFLGSLKKYEQANKLFESVAKFYPDWKTGMVKNRMELTAKATEKVREKAGEQFQKEQGVIAELEGGARLGAGGKPGDVEVPKAADPGILDTDPLQAKRLKEAEAEVSRLRNLMARSGGDRNLRDASLVEDLRKQNAILSRQLKEAEQRARNERVAGNAQARAEAEAELARLRKIVSDANERGNEAMRNATRVDDMRRQNEGLARQLKAAEENLRAMRAELAAAPARGEIDQLNQRIGQLEQEREAMSMALRTSRGQHTEALSKIEILSADMDIMRKQAEELRQAEANLKRDLDKERAVANEVVKGQRKQMDALEQALNEKARELVAAKGQIASLTRQLEESRAAFDELREERDGLLRERDHMAALLKLSEADRTQELIDQNMGLAKQLREANEKVDRLNKDNNAAKDDIVDALRDLAIAKSQINRLRQDNREMENRLQELKDRLRDEEAALVQGKVEADPEEIEMLRDVIRRQLRVQEHRRQAKEVILETAKKLAGDDVRLGEAIDLFEGAEIALSPEEQKLIAEREVDGEFVSPFARDRATVGKATSELNQEMESYDRAATKAYMAGRLLPTRELFELMIERNPGHVAALCKLGVVQIKLGEASQAVDSFRRAVELDTNQAYAHRMLGYSLLLAGDPVAAGEYVRRGLVLAPDDANGYLLMGTISYRMGDMADAEANFKSAISADPVPSEPYFNLALLYANTDRLEEGRERYEQALERGAVPDASLESKLKIKP